MDKSPPPVSFHFSVEIDQDEISCQEVSGISREQKIEEVGSGGENSFKYKLPVAPSSPNLVLKRTLVPKNSNLLEWCQDWTLGKFGDKTRPKDILVKLLDANADPRVSWTFYNAYPVKYTVSDLKSTENSLAIETMEFAYTYFD